MKTVTVQKTQEEIAARLTVVQEHFLDFEGDVLINYLNFSHAKPFLKDGVTESEWDEARESTVSGPLGEIKEYMQFAVDKAVGERGLSAGRSMDRMRGWLWLMGDDELSRKTEDYTNYGLPVLKEICDKYNIEVDWDG